MNATEVEGATIVAHCVPTRAIRVLMLKGELTFRVEQLDPSVWKWSALSTHSGDDPWESYGPALEAATAMQERLKLKIQASIQQSKRARLSILNDASANPERL
jgi:hypothetical protein